MSLIWLCDYCTDVAASSGGSNKRWERRRIISRSAQCVDALNACKATMLEFELWFPQQRLLTARDTLGRVREFGFDSESRSLDKKFPSANTHSVRGHTKRNEATLGERGGGRNPPCVRVPHSASPPVPRRCTDRWPCSPIHSPDVAGCTAGCTSCEAQLEESVEWKRTRYGSAIVALLAARPLVDSRCGCAKPAA